MAAAPAKAKASAIAGQASDTGTVTPKDIYEALINAGASTAQALGIMGNMIAESSLNVETGQGGKVIDSNGYPVYGLVSWNTASYPNASSLVTGNPQKDLKAQVDYLAQTGGFTAASGSTPAQVAANFAENYERCSTCEAGGASNEQRQNNAQQVAGWLTSGDWPTSAGDASAVASLTSAETQQSEASCAWYVSLGSLDPSILGWHPVGNLQAGLCVLSKPQARAVLGAGLLLTGGLVLDVAAVILGFTAFTRVPLVKQAARLAELAGG